jgi:hypothetical protein
MRLTDILKAMATSAAILLPIVVLVIIISIAAVKRGEIAMGGGDHAHAHAHAGAETAGTVAAAARKSGPVVVVNPGVLEILGLGTAIFVVAVLILLGISIVSHM